MSDFKHLNFKLTLMRMQRSATNRRKLEVHAEEHHKLHPDVYEALDCAFCKFENGSGPAKKLEAFGCYVWLEGQTLFCSELGEFEEYGKEANSTGEVTAPEGQAFLDAVNELLDTAFKFEHFAGR